jgi:hypothetical protein
MLSRVALLCVLLSLGCGTPAPDDQPGQSIPEPSALTLQFIRVTKEVPDFGGLTFENGQWVVFLLAPEQRELAEARLRDVFGEEAANIAVRVRAPRGSASSQMVKDAVDVMAVPGVGTLDLDEKVGYVRVGLLAVESLEQAQVKLDELGVPLDQVILYARRPIVLL